MKIIHLLSLILLIACAPLCKAQSFYEHDIQLMKAQTKECDENNFFYTAIFFSKKLNALFKINYHNVYIISGTHEVSFSSNSQQSKLDDIIAKKYDSFNDSTQKAVLHELNLWCRNTKDIDKHVYSWKIMPIAIVYYTKSTSYLVKKFLKHKGDYWGSLDHYQEEEVFDGMLNILSSMNEKQKVNLFKEFRAANDRLLKTDEFKSYNE